MESTFGLFGQTVTLLEAVAAITGVIGVVFTVRRSSWCFPIGMVNVSLYLWLFLQPEIRLLADAFLQGCFFTLLAYGWFQWKKSSGNQPVRPERTTAGEWRWFIPAMLTCGSIIGWSLQRFTDASLPWIDAFLTAASLGAQWMVARRKIENWWLWIAVNTAYIPLFIYKSLPLTAALYTVYLFLAFSGLQSWKREMKQAGHP